MWQKVADIVQENGSQLWLGAEAEGILWSGNRVEALEVKRNGKIELVKVSGIDIENVPMDFLHVVSGTLGSDLGAGLFLNKNGKSK